ncbi:MAG: site-specific integrase [Clostridia bacterium]|nr:site-specific integrase [Clostridia bacterium]
MATGHYRTRKTKNGISYQLTVEADRDPLTGKRDRHYETFRGTKKQMEARLRKFIKEVENGGVVTASAIKLSDWLAQWQSLYLPNIEQSTKNSYKETIQNRINPYIGSIPLKALNTNTIQQWVNSLSLKLSAKTVCNAFNILKPALEKAKVLHLITDNPCVGVEKPKFKKYQANAYTTTEIQNILTTAKNTDLYVVLLLELAAGLRRGELMALKWSDIDLKSGVISISKSIYKGNGKTFVKAPKTTAGIRKIKIPNKVLNVLQEEYQNYLAKKSNPDIFFKDNNLVVCKDDGTSYHPDTISKKWKKFIKKNNIRDARFHDLRHSNATMMIQEGLPAKTVQSRLGHSDISTTLNVYVHYTETMDENAANIIDAIMP